VVQVLHQVGTLFLAVLVVLVEQTVVAQAAVLGVVVLVMVQEHNSVVVLE
jgi:hypothetical protein